MWEFLRYAVGVLQEVVGSNAKTFRLALLICLIIVLLLLLRKAS
jgi:hypothetical protein